LCRIFYARQVIMGGGRKSFHAASTESGDARRPKDVMVDRHVCARTDGRNLVGEWIRDKASKRLSHRYLTDETDVNSLDTENTQYVLGERNRLRPRRSTTNAALFVPASCNIHSVLYTTYDTDIGRYVFYCALRSVDRFRRRYAKLFNRAVAYAHIEYIIRSVVRFGG